MGSRRTDFRSLIGIFQLKLIVRRLNLASKLKLVQIQFIINFCDWYEQF